MEISIALTRSVCSVSDGDVSSKYKTLVAREGFSCFLNFSRVLLT